MNRIRTVGRKDHRRRGFRIVLWLMGLFLLAQLLGGLILDYLWIRVRFPWQAEVYDNLQARAKRPEILFLGSSRFCSNWNCGILDAALKNDLGEQAPRTFNASLPYGDPIVAERLFDDMVHMNYHPRLVVVEVNPVALARRDNWLNHQALRLLDWRDVPEAFTALCKNGKILYLVRGRLLPLYLHRDQICKNSTALMASLFHAQPVPPPCDPPIPATVPADPELPPPLSPAIRAQVQANCNVVAFELRDFQPGGVAGGRLERLLDHCRSMGISVLLVQPPVCSQYRQAIPPQADAAFEDYMGRLCQHYGCRYCNWANHLPDPYFRDEHHAYPEGAVYLSRRFAPGVLVPLWRDLQNLNGSEEGKPRANSDAL
jgi:hypothetical protein